MARKGELAREEVYEVIKKAFGSGFVAVQDKKIYVNMEENGEMVQFAISITQPKNPIESSGESYKVVNQKPHTDEEIDDFFNEENPLKITREEKNKESEEAVRKLKERLGL